MTYDILLYVFLGDSFSNLRLPYTPKVARNHME